MTSVPVPPDAGPGAPRSGRDARRRRDGGGDPVHEAAASRLASLDQRYTARRRALVDLLRAAGRPLTVSEIVAEGAPVSSAYRNVTVLCDAGVARRLVGADDLGRFELSEDLSGHHHHHLVCQTCKTVADVRASSALEDALDAAARLAAQESGFEITDHRIELVGRCPACR
jgi:Fur family ferric uptake transcriptional regulator